MSAKIKTFLDENGNQILPRTNAKAVYMSDSSTTVEDALKIQPDWNQNNLEAKDYIKNRTHYKTKSAKKIFNSCGIDFDNYTFTVDEYGCLYLYDDDMIYNHSYFSDCGIYTVILDGIEYKFNIGEWGGITNGYLTIDSWSGGMSFYFEEDGEENSTHIISIYEEIETYYPLNKKYIPNSTIVMMPILDEENYDFISWKVNRTSKELMELWTSLMSAKAIDIPTVLVKNPTGESYITYLIEVNDGDAPNMYFRGFQGDTVIDVYIDAEQAERGGCYVDYYSPIGGHNEDPYSHSDIRATLKNAIYQGMPNSLPIISNWCDMTAGTDKLIIISTTGEIVTYDTKYGNAWQVETDNDLSTYGNWKAIASCNDFSGDFQVIVGLNASDKIARYYNYGWLQMKTLPHVGNWDHIVYGANKFIVLDSEVSNQGAYSDDRGNSWNEITLPVSAGWGVLTYIDEKFIALANKDSNGNEGSNIGMYSEDGINWTSFTMPESMIWTKVTQKSSDYYAFGYNLTDNTSSVFTIKYYASNYNAWSKKWSYSEIKNGPIASNGKIFIRLKNNSLIEYSTSLSTKDWIELTIPEGDWNTIKYCNQTFFLLENNSNRFAYSKDGFDWIVNDFYLFNNNGEGIVEDLKEILGISNKILPDWNQNDSEAKDYVKNRTHWVESEAYWTPIDSTGATLIGETVTVAGANSRNSFPGTYTLSDCNKYRVTLDGAEYVVEAEYDSNNETYGIYIEPLFIWFTESTLYMHRDDRNGSTDMSVKIESYIEAVCHTIDAKFLPDTVATKPSMTRITLFASGWDSTSLTQSVSIPGISADKTAQLIQCSPTGASMNVAANSGIYCSGQAANTLTFTCTSIPTEKVQFIISWQDCIWIEPTMVSFTFDNYWSFEVESGTTWQEFIANNITFYIEEDGSVAYPGSDCYVTYNGVNVKASDIIVAGNYERGDMVLPENPI